MRGWVTTPHATRDEPLLAGLTVAALDRDGDRLQPVDVRAGVRLGDRVGATKIAADVRQQVALLLRVRRMDQDVGRPPEDGPDAIGDAADLLLERDLLAEGEARSAELDREVRREEAGCEADIADVPS